MIYLNTPPSSISNLVLYPCSAFGVKIIFVPGSILFNPESIDIRFLHLPLYEVSEALPCTRKKKYKPATYPENVKIYDLNPDMETYRHISFEMLISDLRSDCRYLRYFDFKIDKTHG